MRTSVDSVGGDPARLVAAVSPEGAGPGMHGRGSAVSAESAQRSGLSVVLTLRRRSRLRRAITAAGAGDATVFCYWSRVNNPPFLARSGLRASGRGLDAAVTATADGVRVRLLERPRLVEFGLIPWSAHGEVGETAAVGAARLSASDPRKRSW